MFDFLIIDDDPVNNLICSRIIHLCYAEATVLTFINPVTALEEMRCKYSDPGANNVIVFLDIEMPELCGWEVLENFNALPLQIKNHFKFFILSSLPIAKDKFNIINSEYVSGYIPKPLSKFILPHISFLFI